MPRPIAYDLTELFVKQSTSENYYGIARVVHEIGIELFKLNPETKFVIYSQGYRCFHEVPARFDAHHYGGVAFDIPRLLRPQKFRSRSPSSSFIKSVSAPINRALLRRRNRKLWDDAGLELPEFSLDGYAFFSAGRPQILADSYEEIRRRKWNTKTSALVHDLFTFHKLDERYGSTFAGNFLFDTTRLIRVADQIVANSAFTRDEYVHFGNDKPLPTAKSLVTVPLVHYSPPSDERPQYLMPDVPYFLCVGTTTGRKNVEVVFQALLDLKKDHGLTPMLILAGAKSKSMAAYIERPEFSEIRSQVEFVLHPGQRDLNRLYENAQALVIPTRMEGWGLPAGEALYLGCPVISSTAEALVECCGDLAVYFDPDAPKELAAAMARMLTDTAYRSDLQEKIGKNRDRFRSWADVARDISVALHQMPE